MPDLTFKIDSAGVVPFAAVPMIAFQLQIKNSVPDEAIHTIALRCQIQIETTRRRYTPDEQEQMLDLFGTPDRWGQTLRSLLWTHVNLVVPTFAGDEAVIDMQVPCSFDFNVAATKYFAALIEGDIPLIFLFSGTIFYAPTRQPLAGRAHFVGTGSPIQASRKTLARHDGFLLPQHRLDQPSQGRIRAPLSLQNAARPPQLGTGA